MVSVKNEPGALYRLLEPFRNHGIDLTRIETRPSRSRKWSYVFFIDFAGHRDDPAVRLALDEIRPTVVELRPLGSYPRAVL
jgi:chorismate mutase/prephenate dehydratase